MIVSINRSNSRLRVSRRGIVARRIAGGEIGLVGVRPGLEQTAHGLGVAAENRNDQRRHALPVGRVDIRAGGQHPGDSFDVTAARGNDQRRITLFVGKVRIGAPAQKKADKGPAAIGHRHRQRRVTAETAIIDQIRPG